MSERDLNKEINDGAVARDLLNNPLLKEAADYLKDIYIGALMGATTPEGREAAWYMARAHEQFIAHLYRVLDGGRIAKSDLELISKRRARQAA